MEAVARQFVPDGQGAMVLRNGWFSYRWTEILDMAFPGNTHTVLKAVPSAIMEAGHEDLTHFRPAPVEDVVARIREERPKAFFCPHVETSTGMMIPDDYVSRHDLFIRSLCCVRAHLSIASTSQVLSCSSLRPVLTDHANLRSGPRSWGNHGTGLHRFGNGLGGHEKDGRGRDHIGAAEGLDRDALLRSGANVRKGRLSDERAGTEYGNILFPLTEALDSDHGCVREGWFCVSYNHADGQFT